MAKRNNKLKRNEEREASREFSNFGEGVFDSFREIIPVKTAPSFDISDQFKNVAQRLAYSVYEQHEILFLLGPAGTGKSHLACMFAINELLRETKSRIVLTRPIVEAGESLGYLPGPQPLDAKILTPSGWKRMGDIVAGNLVLGRDGKPTKVLDIFPKGKKTVYRLTTTEGTSTECCEDHLWLTRTLEDRKRNRSYCVRSTKEIMSSLLDKKGKINHFLPRNEAVEYTKKELPLDPYFLGVLLGDGNFGDSISFAAATGSEEMVKRIASIVETLNCDLEKNQISYYIRQKDVARKPAKKVVITSDVGVREYDSCALAAKEIGVPTNTLRDRCNRKAVIAGVRYEFIELEDRWSNPVKAIVDRLGLLGKKSYEKFIPDEYKTSSIEDRVELLRGLMDTDGSIKESGEASFTTTSKTMALDVIELVKSLGGRAILPKARNRLDKKAYLNGRAITGNKVSYEFNVSLPTVNPFFISRKSKRYSPPKYIHQIGIKCIEVVGEKEVQCILVENSEHLYLTDDFIVTHNTFSEKTDPYMLPLYDCIRKMIPGETALAKQIQENTEVAPLAYMRGRTFDDSVCILDEAQNCTWEQLLLFLTRLGESSKMIITGDPYQSDIGRDSALMDVVHRLEGLSGVGMVKFTEEHIVRHRLVSQILKRLQRNS